MKPWDRERFLDRLRSWLLGSAALVLIGLVFYLGTRSERSGFVREVIDPGFKRISTPVLNAFRGEPPTVARLVLSLPPMSWDSLGAWSERAYLKQRIAVAAKPPASEARLLIGDRDLPAQLGVHSGAFPMGRPRFWPFEVALAAGDTVLTMQRFEVCSFTDASILWSVLFQVVMADQGAVSPNTMVAEVTVNDHDLDLCALIGTVDHTILARVPGATGHVLRYDDALYLNARAEMNERKRPSRMPTQADWLAAPLLIQGGDDRYSGTARSAVRRLEAFRAGQFPASTVFEPHALARIMALSDLFGTQDHLDWWNLRFLVDSLSADLMVLPLPLLRHAPISSILGQQVQERTADPGRAFVDRALEDQRIHDLYLAYLDTFSSEGWWESTGARTRPVWDAARKVVNADKPHLDLDLDEVLHDRTVIRQSLYPQDIALAYVNDTLASTDGLVLANVHGLPFDVVGVVLTTGDSIIFHLPLRVEPRSRDRPLRYTYLPLDLPGSPREILIRLGPALPPRGVRIRTWSSLGSN